MFWFNIIGLIIGIGLLVLFIVMGIKGSKNDTDRPEC